MVASIYGNDPECKPDEVMCANARLIAAAPELLSALSDLLEAADSMRATFGRLHGSTPEDCDIETHEQWAEEFLKERAEAARAAIFKATGEQP